MGGDFLNTITVDEAIVAIDKYSRAVSFGTAIFAAEKYIYDYLQKERNEKTAELGKAKELLAKANKSINDTDVIKADIESLKRELLDSTIPPYIRLTFSDEVDIGQAFLYPPKSKFDKKEQTKYFRIVLPQQILDRFRYGRTGCVSVECPYQDAGCTKPVGSCGIVRDCLLKDKLRTYTGHELSHAVDHYLNYTANLKTNEEKEKVHFYFAEQIAKLRDAYLQTT